MADLLGERVVEVAFIVDLRHLDMPAQHLGERGANSPRNPCGAFGGVINVA
ncbi:hypothetical protein ACH4VT_35015 [Streptomyces lydicus]|uniref:hypothetical protein n=1 Tax=Streptomyces lydicus TaxID=47763 RepID=UPI0037ACDC6A